MGRGGAILDVLIAALVGMGKDAGEELQLATLDVGVELVEEGYVLPVLDAAAKTWYHHTDYSSLRYFAGEVLEIAGPPYSTAFASAMLHLLKAANAQKGGGNRAVDEFIDECARQHFSPPLGADEEAALRSLSRRR